MRPPRGNRIGLSAIIRFSMHTSPGVSEKQSENQKVKAGLVLRKYGLRPQRTIEWAEVPSLAFRCALDQALARKIKNQKIKKVESWP